MSSNKDMWFALLYYLLYAPLSFVIWYLQGARSLTEFIVAQCIGLFILLLFLVVKLVFVLFAPKPLPRRRYSSAPNFHTEKALASSVNASSFEPSPPTPKVEEVVENTIGDDQNIEESVEGNAVSEEEVKELPVLQETNQEVDDQEEIEDKGDGEDSHFSTEFYRRMFAMLTSQYNMKSTEISTQVGCTNETLLDFVGGNGYLTRYQKQKIRDLYTKKSKEKGPMSHHDMLHSMRSLYDLSTAKLAEKIGYSRETIRRWLNGDEVKKQPQKDAIVSAYTKLILDTPKEKP